MRVMRIKYGVGLIGLLAVACVPPNSPRGYLNVGEGGEVEESSALALTFEQSSAQYDVHPDILKGVAYVETRFEIADGEVEFEGQPAPFGIFGLREAQILKAAELTGLTTDQIREDTAANIEAAAALLSFLADQYNLTEEQRANPFAWKQALESWGSLDEEMSRLFSVEVIRAVSQGVAVAMRDGTTLVVYQHENPVESNIIEQGLGAQGAIWRASPNYSSRRGSKVDAVIIHTCEGAYSGCVSWLRDTRSRASAHYVVSEDGREVSQLVDEENKAWHIAATYRSRLNSGKLSAREGQSSNNFTIGIEHAGRASQASWPPNQIDASVELVKGIVKRHNIPPDRYHIVAHGQLQPENRTDPGPNWPWASYLSRIASGTPAAEPPPPPSSGPYVPPSTTIPTVITVDNSNTARFRASGNWQRSSYASGKVGRDYRYVSARFTSDPAQYKIPIGKSGRYEVYIRIPGNGYNTSIPYVIRHANGKAVVRVNTKYKGSRWVSLGTYQFTRKDDWIFGISRWTRGTGWITADAVRFISRS